MLSDIAVQALSVLSYRSDAKWKVNLLPFGSIYWEDEMPDIRKFVEFREEDSEQILRMFSIRLRLWEGDLLCLDDQQLWDSLRSQVPDWALFARLRLTDQQKEAQKEAERQVELEFETGFGDRDHK
jgi:ribonucleotide reductase alpha subunit